MEEKNKIETMTDHLREYLEIKWKILVLDSTNIASDVASNLASVFLISILMLFVLLFLSIGAALWIGDTYGNSSIGFLFVGLFYLLISIVIIVFKDPLIKTPVINKFIQALSTDEKN